MTHNAAQSASCSSCGHATIYTHGQQIGPFDQMILFSLSMEHNENSLRERRYSRAHCCRGFLLCSPPPPHTHPQWACKSICIDLFFLPLSSFLLVVIIMKWIRGGCTASTLRCMTPVSFQFDFYNKGEMPFYKWSWASGHFRYLW